MATKIITAFGNAQLDTADKEFGSASGLFDGNGDYLTTPDDPAWAYGSGDFTIDFWFKTTTTLNAQRFYNQNDGAGNLVNIGEFGAAGLVQFLAKVGGVDKADYRLVTGISANAWTHMAVVRNGTSFLWFVGGVSQTLTTLTAIGSNSLADIAASLFIAASEVPDTYYTGWLDEYRVSNIARWTSDFTPPTSAYTTDANTLLLLHMDGADASTSFIDSSVATTSVSLLASLDAG